MLGGTPAWRRRRHFVYYRGAKPGSTQRTSRSLGLDILSGPNARCSRRGPGRGAAVWVAGWAEAASRNSTPSSGSELHPRFLCKETWGSRWVLVWFFVFFGICQVLRRRGPRTPPGAGLLTAEPARPAPSRRLRAAAHLSAPVS